MLKIEVILDAHPLLVTFEALLACAMSEELESVLDGEILDQVTQALQQVLDQHDWGALY